MDSLRPPRLCLPRRAFAVALGIGLFCACEPATERRAPESDATFDDAATTELDAGGATPDSTATAPQLDSEIAADAGATDAASGADGGSREGLCGRNDDPVRDLFCAPAKPSITGLRQLQVALRLNLIPEDVSDEKAAAHVPDPDAVFDQMAFMGHSTALAGQLVSPLNPRVLLFGQGVFMAFQRGVQQVELAAFNRDGYAVNLYLVTFRQACNQREGGCRPGDLFTPSVEREWLDVELQDAEDLKNTPSDCRQCHQRVRGKPMLLMRELQGPWRHFFADRNDPSVTAFQQAKGPEIYAGVPTWAMAHTAGFNLQSRVEVAQPLEFKPTIVDELDEQDADAGARRSASWDKAYQAFKRGEQLALPYFEAVATDPVKQARLSEAYQRYREGKLPADQLPDLGDIFPDDPQIRAEIGLQTEPNATAAEALIQACGPCHNDRLDQSISRARFNIALGRMSRAELDVAIGRIEQAQGSTGVMPPPETRQLDAAGRARLLEYLRAATRPAEDEATLERAAHQGMATDPWDGLIIDATPETYDAGKY